jgi:uncharacterized phage-associated protein
MVAAVDVADFIRQSGIRDRYSVQKLLYYCQAWSLAWDGEPLFADPIEAWVDGPVCRAAWVDQGGLRGNAARLTSQQRATAQAVLGFYGQRESWWLIDLTHREAPWRETRDGLLPNARSDAQIPLELMRKFYGAYGLPPRQFTSEFKETMELLASMPEEALANDASEELVDAEPFLNWLETGEGDPWVNSSN